MPNLVLRGLKAALGPVKRRLLGPVARAANDYATHIPVLLALAQSVKVERVLELGCGQFSTLTFVNRRAFPALLELDSIETDQAWLDKVALMTSNDSRLRTSLVQGAMSSAMEQMELGKYDLILVDDSSSSAERAGTIIALAARKPTRAIVAIHDFEVRPYRDAAAGFQHRFTFNAFNPQTGIGWYGKKELAGALRHSNSVIKRYAKKLEPDDIEGWKEVLVRHARRPAA